MKTLRNAACVLLAAVSFLASPAFATAFATDQSDLWYIPADAGWGLQLVDRGNVIFGTLFVYAPSGQPTWYTATMDYTSGFTWTGALYATTGTYFGMPWAGLTSNMAVGTMTWTAQTAETGTLTYVVNGTTVVKNVIRQALVFSDYSGHFGGGIHSDITGCANPSFNGTVETIGVLNITQNGSAIELAATNLGTGGSCSYPGTLTQFGQMGDVSGNYACSDGGAGTFQLFEMTVTENGVLGRFAASSSSPPGCQSSGWFGGLVVTTF